MKSNEDQEINDWRNEHGEPDFNYLESLRRDGSIEALEKLKSIAMDLDVDFDEGISIPDLIDRIRTATKANEEGNTNTTN